MLELSLYLNKIDLSVHRQRHRTPRLEQLLFFSTSHLFSCSIFFMSGLLWKHPSLQSDRVQLQK